jgi:TRAP transporter 4TM/12TM fusion protein
VVALPAFGVVFIAYAIFGHLLPEPFHHPHVSMSRIITYFGMSMVDGIYGALIYMSANIIFLFILFGVILELTRAREFFTMIGLLVGRKIRGGAAQTSVVASGFVGMISGSPAANIVITGMVTIPLMRRTGFKAKIAAAVEATASTGGIFLPPVMGVVAFMMMSLTGLSYWTICVAALIPAILYYLGVATGVHLHASKEKIPPATEEVDLKLMLRRAPLFIVPFGLITTLLALRYPPMYAAGWAMVVGALLGFIRKETRPSWKIAIEGITRGAQTGATIGAMICLSDLAFVSVMSLTAVAPKIAGVMHAWGGGYLPAILLLTGIISLLMGTINPIAGSYLLVALVVTPVLLDMNLSIIQAHFFALYYGILGMLTPPVAPSVIIASGIAKTRFLGAVLPALRLAGPAYLLPIMFAYDPALLAQFGRGPWLGLLSIMVAALAIITLAIVLYNYYIRELRLQERGLAAVSWLGFTAYFFTLGNMWTVLVGAASLVLLTLSQTRRRATA